MRLHAGYISRSFLLFISKLIYYLCRESFCQISKNLRPGGSVGAGVVGGSVGKAWEGENSHKSVCRNANSSRATKLSTFLPFSASIITWKLNIYAQQSW